MERDTKKNNSNTYYICKLTLVGEDKLKCDYWSLYMQVEPIGRDESDQWPTLHAD